jgi:hypothetical protein
MLEFNLNQVPPTHEQIDAEKVRRVAGYISFSRRKSRFVPLILWVYAVFFVSGTIWLYVQAAKHPTINEVAGYTCLSALGLLIPICLIYWIVIERKEKLDWSTTPLGYLDEEWTPRRCQMVAEACGKDARCDAYRLAVAQQGRDLTSGEADMILERVNGPLARQTEGEREYERLISEIIRRS